MKCSKFAKRRSSRALLYVQHDLNVDRAEPPFHSHSHSTDQPKRQRAPFSLLSSRSSTFERKCANVVAVVAAIQVVDAVHRSNYVSSVIYARSRKTRSDAVSRFEMKPKPAPHYVDGPFVPWMPVARQPHPSYYRHPDPIDWQNFKSQSSLGSTYSDFSGNSAIGNKGRDYYFLSSHYRNPVPNLNHTEHYLGRDRRRQLRPAEPAPTSCPCNRSRSMEDMRTDIVTEWEDDDENGNRIIAPATKFNRPTYRFSSVFKKNSINHLSMENLSDTAPQVLPPKRAIFQVIINQSMPDFVFAIGVPLS